MKRVSLVNCANGVAHSIIRGLTSRGVQVKVADLYPSYRAVQNFLYFKDTLSPEQQALIESDQQLETTQDLNIFLKGSENVIINTHNYYHNVTQKERLTKLVVQVLAKQKSGLNKVVMLTPLEHLHYSENNTISSHSQLFKDSLGQIENMVQVETELLFGEDASALHVIVRMLANGELDQDFGQNYLTPLHSQDLQAGMIKILESDTLPYRNYVFRGSSTHKVSDLLNLIKQKVDLTNVQRSGLLQMMEYEEINVNEMFMQCNVSDFGKGNLKSFGIDTKEFMNLEYTPQQVDKKSQSLAWSMFCQ